MKKLFVCLLIVFILTVSINAESLLDNFKFSQKKLFYNGKKVTQVVLIRDKNQIFRINTSDIISFKILKDDELGTIIQIKTKFDWEAIIIKNKLKMLTTKGYKDNDAFIIEFML